MITNTECVSLQQVYLQSRSDADGAKLYSYLREYALILLRTIMKQRGVRASKERQEEVSHDAAAEYIANLIRFPGNPPRQPSSILYLQIQSFLFSRSDQRHKRLITDAPRGVVLPPEVVSTKNEWILELANEHPKGSKLVADFYRYALRGHTYRWCIVKVNRYIEKKWLLQYAVQLRAVWKTFNWSYQHGKKADKTILQHSDGGIRKDNEDTERNTITFETSSYLSVGGGLIAALVRGPIGGKG